MSAELIIECFVCFVSIFRNKLCKNKNQVKTEGSLKGLCKTEVCVKE